MANGKRDTAEGRAVKKAMRELGVDVVMVGGFNRLDAVYQRGERKDAGGTSPMLALAERLAQGKPYGRCGQGPDGRWGCQAYDPDTETLLGTLLEWEA